MSKSDNRRDHQETEADWISSLIERSDAAKLPSKEERIEKRQAKKQRRQIITATRNDNLSKDRKTDKTQGRRMESRNKHLMQKNKMVLTKLSQYILTCIEDLEPPNQRNLYQSNEPKGKAIAWKKRKWTDETVQPERRHYGGLGLARPSLFLSLSDPSFIPKLEEEFQEHIPGFFGKQRTKAMKKQLDGNMLWRQLAQRRHTKVNGQDLSNMTPEQRVETLIAAGYLH
jgi:hypothetical protein